GSARATEDGAGAARATAEEPAPAAELAAVMARFEVVVESSAEGVRKPDPRIYRLALDRMNAAGGGAVTAGRTAYLDDLGVNLKPARAMGMATVKVADPDAALDELEQLVGFGLR
ncbi:MAG TPA: hypothetical protein DEP69_00125, partial [Acidimicrobiaceae bacterium]|nr:hypothetical protein [Acidimicrobiaceae bacterium]